MTGPSPSRSFKQNQLRSRSTQKGARQVRAPFSCRHERDCCLPRVADEKAAADLIGSDPRVLHTAANLCHVGFAWKLDRPVAQANCVGRRGADALALPDVEAEVMVVAAGRDE